LIVVMLLGEQMARNRKTVHNSSTTKQDEM